jgi:hypothetical protein
MTNPNLSRGSQGAPEVARARWSAGGNAAAQDGTPVASARVAGAWVAASAGKNRQKVIDGAANNR